MPEYNQLGKLFSATQSVTAKSYQLRRNIQNIGAQGPLVYAQINLLKFCPQALLKSDTYCIITVHIWQAGLKRYQIFND